MNVHEAIAEGERYLKKKKYAESTFNAYVRLWLYYVDFLIKRGNDREVTLESIRSFFIECYNFDIENPTMEAGKYIITYLRYITVLYSLATGQKPKRMSYYRRFLVHLSSYFADLLEGYKEYLKKNAASEATTTDYVSVVRLFFAYLTKNDCIDVKTLTKNDVKSFLRENGDYAPKTVSNYRCALRSLSDYLFKKGYTPKQFTDGFLPIKQQRKGGIITALDMVQTSALINYLKTIESKTPIGKRNTLIILLAVCCGLRIRDILRLKFKNIDYPNKSLVFIMSKTGKPHTAPFSDTLVEPALKDYIENGRPDKADKGPDKYIFVTHQAPFSRLHGSMYGMLQRILDKSNVNVAGIEHTGMHFLRHTFASLLISSGMDYERVALLMGHTDLNQTLRYIQLSDDAISKCALPPQFLFSSSSAQ